MPQSSDELRAKFMTDECPDGIETAEKMIRDAGGAVEHLGQIYAELIPLDNEAWEAVQFLLEEWDYCLINEDEFNNLMNTEQ